MDRDKTQAERFREAARALDCDDDDAALDRAMGKLDLTRKPDPEPKKPADK